MKYQAAFSLLYLAGTGQNPTKKDVEQFMKACGVSVDKESLDLFFEKIEGKDIVEAIEEGSKKLVSMPTGGYAQPTNVTSDPAPAKVDLPVIADEPVGDVAISGLFGDSDEEY